MSGKISGLGATVIVDDTVPTARTISNDVTDFQFKTPRGIQDITGVDKSAHERLLLLADYSCTLKGVFNSADANMSHAVFKSVPSTSVNRNVKIEPTSGSTPYLSCLCVLSAYDITRSTNGDLTWQVQADLADGTVPTWNLYLPGSSKLGIWKLSYARHVARKEPASDGGATRAPRHRRRRRQKRRSARR